MKRFSILIIMVFAWLQTAQAGGYQIGEMASRSTGMGGAFTAVADDSSAAWYNPAGVAFMDSGAQVLLGGAAIISTGVDYTPNASTGSLALLGFPAPAATSSKSKTFFIPHAYFTYWDENSRLGASLSINSPFGLESDWPGTSSLAASSTFALIQMVMVNPSVIFKLTDNIAVSAGFEYAYLNKVRLNNSIQLLEGKNKDGWGGTASIMYKNDALSVGVTYHSQVKIDINGGTILGGPGIANLAGLLAPTPLAPLIPALPGLVGATTTASTSLTLPDQVNVGIAWKATPDLLLSLDVDWVNWNTFDEIRLTYAPSTLTTVLTKGSGVKAIPENWKDTVAIRVGAEWKYNPQMRARFGYVYDPTPIKDVDFTPAIPGNDRHIFSVGYGYDFMQNATVDLAYAFVYFQKRHQTTSTGGTNVVRNGTYKANAHILTASLAYSF